MKRIITSTVVFLTTFLSAFGDTFYGTITQTITETNDPLYSVGQTFVGYYQYESSSVDGTFFTPPTYMPPLPGQNRTLSGSVYTPWAKVAEVYYSVPGHGLVGPYYLTAPGGHFRGLLDGPINIGKLVVENGSVVDFTWAFDQGGFYAEFYENTFQALSFYDKGPAYPLPYTRGTVGFSTPTRVPDGTGTFSLVVGALLGLGCFRRRIFT